MIPIAETSMGECGPATRASDRTQGSKWVSRLKSVLKRSSFLSGLVRAAQGLHQDARTLVWLALRPFQIKRYLADHPHRRSLHVGASRHVLDNWLNTDLEVTQPGVVYLDATRRLPFAEGVFDHVMAEHMIEHIDHASARKMLSEFLRVLKRGGRVRLATPDLRALVEIYTSPERSPMQSRYVDWLLLRTWPEATHSRELFVLNTAVRAWGHQFLYDAQALRSTLEDAGFDDIRFYRPGSSDDPSLCNLEAHGRVIQAEDINQFETIVVEARKPLPRPTEESRA